MDLFEMIERVPRLVRLFIRALAVSVATVFLVALEPTIRGYFSGTPIVYAVLKVSAWVILLLFFAFGSLLLENLRDLQSDRERRKAQAVAFAYERVDEWLIKSLADERLTPIIDVADESLNAVAQAFRASITRLMEGLYETLESHFSDGLDPSRRVEFEVTFMTKSLVDDGITIAAWASRSHRAPRSLSLRKSDPGLYKDTETAKIYNMHRPTALIVTDTDEDPSYAEVYPGQKSHIKSSIIYPVLDEMNVVCGTIVCHCDQVKFFKERERKFWSTLVEVFSRRVALTQCRAIELCERRKGELMPPW